MKAVLISLRPEWVTPIFITKEKIYEVRKRSPLLELPYKVYVYCTLSKPMLYVKNKHFSGNVNGLVCGEFTVTNHIEKNPPWKNKAQGTSLTDKQLAEYSMGNKVTFMEISNPILYNNPFELTRFGIKRPPQSFQFVEEIE